MAAPKKKAPAKRPGKTSAPKAAKKALDPAAVADAALKARFQAELARFDRARGDETAGWDEMYEALGEILYATPPLYLAGGYKTVRAFLAEALPGVSENTVRASVRVAKYFEPEDEKRYGVSKLQLFLDYLEARGGAELRPGKIDLRGARVEVDRGKKGSARKLPLDEVSYDELRAAVRVARGAAPRAKKAEAPPVAALRKALAREKLGAVGVRLRGDALDLTGVPLSSLESLGRLLVKLKLPAE